MLGKITNNQNLNVSRADIIKMAELLEALIDSGDSTTFEAIQLTGQLTTNCLLYNILEKLKSG